MRYLRNENSVGIDREGQFNNLQSQTAFGIACCSFLGGKFGLMLSIYEYLIEQIDRGM
jgi:hypothetical protein